MNFFYDDFDEVAAYAKPSKPPKPPSFMKIKPSDVGGLNKEQIIEACKAMYPEEFV